MFFFLKKTISGILGIGAKVKGEDDFGNLFTNGDISSSGGLSGTIGFGYFDNDVEFQKDMTLRGKQSLYALGYFSFDPEFTNLKSIINPASSLKKETTNYYNPRFRVGANGYWGFAEHAGVLLGYTHSWGESNNISALSKANINVLTSTIGDSTLIAIDPNVYIGVLDEFKRRNHSIDLFVSYQTIGLYSNVNFDHIVDYVDEDKSKTTSWNLGLYFLEKKEEEKDDEETIWYEPKFGIIFGWNNRGDSSIGVAGNLRFGSYNIPKAKAATPAK